MHNIANPTTGDHDVRDRIRLLKNARWADSFRPVAGITGAVRGRARKSGARRGRDGNEVAPEGDGVVERRRWRTTCRLRREDRRWSKQVRKQCGRRVGRAAARARSRVRTICVHRTGRVRRVWATALGAASSMRFRAKKCRSERPDAELVDERYGSATRPPTSKHQHRSHELNIPTTCGDWYAVRVDALNGTVGGRRNRGVSRSDRTAERIGRVRPRLLAGRRAVAGPDGRDSRHARCSRASWPRHQIRGED